MWWASLVLVLAPLQLERLPEGHPMRIRADPMIWWDWTPLRFVDRSGVYNLGPADLGIDSGAGRHVVFGGRNPDDCPGSSYWCGLYHQFSADGLQWTRPLLIPETQFASVFQFCEVLGNETGRVYVCWLGNGIQLCWTDDRGQSFSPPVMVSGALPSGDDFDITIDDSGALHVAWLGVEWDGLGDVWENVYYTWSSATYCSDTSGQRHRRDPVFHPGYAVSDDRSGGGLDITLAVTRDQWVTISWQDLDQYLRITQAYAGAAFPPSWDPGSGRIVRNPWAVSFDDGAVTVFYDRYGPPDYKRLIYTSVAEDGRTFEGPFVLPPPDFQAGFLSLRRCVQRDRSGRVEILWGGGYFPDGSYGIIHSTSLDYGRTLLQKTLIYDNRIYPGSGDPSLDLLPDGRPALIDYIHHYGEAQR
ncbi:MAG: hypothetical protein AB1486_30805 [Planctomycetota bacterium]